MWAEPVTSAVNEVALWSTLFIAPGGFNFGVKGALSAAERIIVPEASGILASGSLRGAIRSGISAELNIGGRLVIFEPAAPVSGMTLFQEGGFVIGREAVISGGELTRTVLHELYRLNFGLAGRSGVSGSLASYETQAAFNFAQQAARLFGY